MVPLRLSAAPLSCGVSCGVRVLAVEVGNPSASAHDVVDRVGGGESYEARASVERGTVETDVDGEDVVRSAPVMRRWLASAPSRALWQSI
jgi:hypothetical protein